jgi:hypothetical protein
VFECRRLCIQTPEFAATTIVAFSATIILAVLTVMRVRVVVAVHPAAAAAAAALVVIVLVLLVLTLLVLGPLRNSLGSELTTLLIRYPLLCLRH